MNNNKSRRYIIGNGPAEENINAIKRNHSLLPKLYRDVMSFRYGLDGDIPCEIHEIVDIFHDFYHIPVTAKNVEAIINESLYMVNFEPDSFEPVLVGNGAIDGSKITWPDLIALFHSYEDEKSFNENLKTQYSGRSFIQVPRIDDIYYVSHPVRFWEDEYDEPQFFSQEEILDLRGFGEFVLNKMDKMGLILIGDMFDTGCIQNSDVYKYAYLNTSLAEKIAFDNPVELLKKKKRFVNQAERSEE